MTVPIPNQVELGQEREVILRCPEEEGLTFLMTTCLEQGVDFSALAGPSNAVSKTRYEVFAAMGPTDPRWWSTVKQLFDEIGAVERKIRVARITDFPLLRISPMLPTVELTPKGEQPAHSDDFTPLSKSMLTNWGHSSVRNNYPNMLLHLSVVVDFGCSLGFELDDVPTQDV